MWPISNRQQTGSRELPSRHQQQYGGQSTGWLSDLPLQLIDRLNNLNDSGDFSPNGSTYGQQRDYFASDQLQDFAPSRGSYESEMLYHSQQNGHENQYLAFDNTFYNHRSKDFTPIDRRSRSSLRPNGATYTPTSIIDQSSGFSVTPSPPGECSRENSPPPPTTLAPCRQLPCR